jgi:hypothetical protein
MLTLNGQRGCAVVKSLAELVMATEPKELTGKVVDGVVIFENGETLPDGTIVRVEPIAPEPKPTSDSHDFQQLREMLLSHAGVINDPDLPTDLADNLDHYLYGTPKRR